VIAQVNDPLYRAYLLKEELRIIFRVPYEHAKVLLESWLKWARRCRIEPFVKLARTITYYRQDIEATLLHWGQQRTLGGGQHEDPPDRPESFRSHSAKALIALSELTLGGPRPAACELSTDVPEDPILSCPLTRVSARTLAWRGGSSALNRTVQLTFP
jgi:transposase